MYDISRIQRETLPLQCDFLHKFVMMIGKNKIKFIRSLQQKKNRMAEGLFVAEGPKTVGELLPVFNATLLIATKEWMAENALPAGVEVIVVEEEMLGKISFLQHPQQVIGIFRIPDDRNDASLFQLPDSDLVLALDGVQDPGNLGTIIRIADWFGITTLFCSPDTADAYNPKVVQATMGSIARVRLVYTDLKDLLDALHPDTPVYGTLLNGEDIYQQSLSRNGLIVMGNEGKGLSKAIASRVTHRLLIPSFPTEKPTAESLNVAIATAVVCAEFRRRFI